MGVYWGNWVKEDEMDRRSAHKIVIGKSNKKETFGRLIHREDNKVK
jgi:hypothetical protein